MAKLIPNIQVDEITEDSERLVAMALVELLPDNCVVYHSFPWLRPDRNDWSGSVTLSEGETDFLILHPDLGLMVLEVKGGEVKYSPETRQWVRRVGLDGIKTITDPFEQARRNTHSIIDRIKEIAFPREANVPFAYGYAVVFPHCLYSGPTPPGAEPVIVWDATDLGDIHKKVEKGMKAWSKHDKPLPLDRQTMRAVQKAISPAFKLTPALFRVVESQEEQLVRLTDDQLRVLEMLGAHSRVLVEGVAGSGKTMLAREQARRFAGQGKRTLLLCYNKGLAQWLDHTLPGDVDSLITVRHFHRLCNEKAQKAGLAFSPLSLSGKYKDRDFWMEVAPEILLDAIGMTEERFDAIVVDEGQDFHPDWWLPIESINAEGEGGPLYIFYDSAQNLFLKENTAFPIDTPPLKLPINCRNTKMIAETCGGFIDSEIATHPQAPSGTATKQFEYADLKEGRSLIKGELTEWLKAGRLKPSQVVIICPMKREKSILGTLDSLGSFKLTNDQDVWVRGQGILVTTIRAFKGLEADAVLLIDAQEIERSEHMSSTDFYVGCSRAKHLLTIGRMKNEFTTSRN